MENSEDEIYDSTEDWRKAIFDKLHNMEYTMYGIKEKTDMTLHTMELVELAVSAIFKLLDRLTALFLGAAECPEDRISTSEKHLRLTAEARVDGLSDLGGEITYHGSTRTSPSPPKRTQVSAVRRRLLNPKHRVLMVNTPIILVALLLLHPKDAIPGCLMYLTTGLIWFFLLPTV